jgi:hypothetical protein
MGYPALFCERDPSKRSKPVQPSLLQEWLRTAALAKRTRDASSKGASFAFCAGISRGGPGRAVAACLSVLTAGSPGHPRWPTGWAESLSGSLRRRVPG